MSKNSSQTRSTAVLMIILLFSAVALTGCGSESYDVPEPVVNASAPITINDGALSTLSPTVTLKLHGEDADDVVGYFISENSADPAAGDPAWQATSATFSFDTTVTYAFADPAAYGIKTIYVWFKDGRGNVSPAASAQIRLSAPVSTGC